MILRRRQRTVASDPSIRRRSAAEAEAHWWDDDDQRWIEGDLLTERDLGDGWKTFTMMNNVERLDPFAGGAGADRLRAVKAGRVLTALDEGRAWRRAATRSLIVARYEVYREAPAEHRQAWLNEGPEVLDETFRSRWRERDRAPGWIEARWFDGDDRPRDVLGRADEDVDWLRVEDHTGDGRSVTIYHHLTVWAGRLTATLTMRQALGVELEPGLAQAARTLVTDSITRRSDPGPESA